MNRRDIFTGDYSRESEHGDMSYENLKFDKNDVFLVTGGAGFIGSN